MKPKFFRFAVLFTTTTLLCSGVAQAGFWSRLLGGSEKVETIATTGQEGATASAPAAMTLNAETALATAASIKSALASVATQGQQLRTLLANQPELQTLLDKALSAAEKGDDLLALDQIEALGDAAKLTDSQSKLVKELKQDFEVLALGRNFPADGPVSDAIAQIKGAEYGKALSTLGDMAKDGSLTEQQRSILNKVIGQHTSDLKRLLPF